jgi:hypothetical protein
MAHSVIATAHPASVPWEIIAYQDADDPPYPEDVLAFAQWVRGPRITLSDCWNKCAKRASGEIFMQCNDDVIFRTSNWNEIISKVFEYVEDRIVMVHGSDGGKRASSFGPHPFVHRRWYETLGYFTPPFFSSDYGDTWINELANAIGRRSYVPSVLFEHMHFTFNKSDIDETTSERLVRHSRDSVERLYDNLEPLRRFDIEKLRAAMR